MLSELNSADKVAGAKQVKRALNDGRAKKLFLAADADPGSPSRWRGWPKKRKSRWRRSPP